MLSFMAAAMNQDMKIFSLHKLCKHGCLAPFLLWYCVALKVIILSFSESQELCLLVILFWTVYCIGSIQLTVKYGISTCSCISVKVF